MRKTIGPLRRSSVLRMSGFRILVGCKRVIDYAVKVNILKDVKVQHIFVLNNFVIHSLKNNVTSLEWDVTLASLFNPDLGMHAFIHVW